MEQDNRQTDIPRALPVRRGDIDPYTALRWVSSLFKGAAVFLAVAVIAEFIAGLKLEGLGALPILMGELARTAVLAVVLWGGGDLVRLLIHLGHDVRTQRIILARIEARSPRPFGEPEPQSDSVTPESAASPEPPPNISEAAD